MPASYFRNTVKVVEEFKEAPQKQEVPKETTETKKTVLTSIKTLTDNGKKNISGLSLKSLKKKKQEIVAQQKIQSGKTSPTDDFTQIAFDQKWQKYLDRLRKNHKKNLLSILTIDKKPKVVDGKIHLTLPSRALKKELERSKEKVLKYLRYNLNNYDIDFVITVKEAMKQDLVYTNQDKFRKMTEKYPDLVYLKQKFKLDF